MCIGRLHHIYIYISVCVCMNMCIYIYTHTYIHKYILCVGVSVCVLTSDVFRLHRIRYDRRLEDFQLPDEGLGVAAFAVDPLHQLVQFDQIARVSAAVQLVLEIVLDVPHELI